MDNNRKKGVKMEVDSNSVASVDSTGKRKSFRRLITRFAEKTSMQGVPYINNAKFWWAKLLWSILLIAAVAAMALHLWYLFTQYYSRPIQTKIQLGFSNLRFPQVTLCNTNLIHKGRLDNFKGASELKSLVAALKPENLVPDQYDANYDPYTTKPPPNQQTNPQPTQQTDPQRTQQPDPQPTQLPDPQPTQQPDPQPTQLPDPQPTQQPDPQPTQLPDPQPTQQPDPQPTQQPDPQPTQLPDPQPTQQPDPQPTQQPDPQPTQLPDPQPTQQPDPQPTQQPDPQPTQQPDPQSSQQTNQPPFTGVRNTSRSTKPSRTLRPTRRPSTGSPPLVESSSKAPAKRRKRFVDNYNNLDPKNYKPDFKGQESDRELQDDEYDEPVDSTTQLSELFTELYMDLNKKDRAHLGHNISDMLLSCTFNGRKCTAKQFKLLQTSEFGNCWSIGSNKFNVQKAGPEGGLSLLLYLESTEYLTGLATGYGARIQVQEPNTYPFPAQEGIFIPASMETSMGLKMLRISRQGQPYGDCEEGVEFRKLYKHKYTRRACQSLCKINEIINTCKCFDDKNEEIANTRNSSLRLCRSEKEDKCLENLAKKFDRKEMTCTCHNPCSEITYERTSSNRQWPNDDYARVLLQGVCDDNPAVCKLLRDNLNDKRALNNNFLKLNIYYSDLNFENITEVPEIEEAQFVSDVGGALGLWIGLSVLSMCELLQLLLELCDYGVHKSGNDRRREKKKRRKENRANRDRSNANSASVFKDNPKSQERQGHDRDIERQWPNTHFELNDKYPRNMYSNYTSNGKHYSDRKEDRRNHGNHDRHRDDSRSWVGH